MEPVQPGGGGGDKDDGTIQRTVLHSLDVEGKICLQVITCCNIVIS